MALTQGLIDSYWRKYNQRRALTGLPTSYQEQRGMLDPMMESVANKDMEEARLRAQYDIQNRQLTLQEQAQKDAARAATVSGVANLAQTGVSGYLGYKYLAKPALTPSATSAPLGSNIPSASAAAYNPSVTAGASGVQYGSGVGAGVGSGGSGILAGAGSGAMTPAEFSALTADFSTVGAGAGTEAAAASSSMFGAVAPYALPAALAFLPRKLGSTVADKLGTHEKTTTDVMETAGYAAAGFMVAGPLGAAAGAAYGVVKGIADTVICSELLRQGEMTERDRTKCVVFRFRHIPDDMFMAYLEWAEPIVALMRKGGITNMLLLPFAKAFVNYMIAVQDGRKPSLMERLVWKYAWSRCEYIAHRQALGVKAVA